jgi:hypothetical protein
MRYIQNYTLFPTRHFDDMSSTDGSMQQWWEHVPQAHRDACWQKAVTASKTELVQQDPGEQAVGTPPIVPQQNRGVALRKPCPAALGWNLYA